MSTITKQAVQAIADLKSGYTLGHADVEIIQQMALEAVTLLDELEAKDTRISEQADTIANQDKWIRAIEEAMITSNDRAEAAERRIAELEATQGKPVMFIDGDISPADADKLAAVIREFNEETETPAARMARIIRENPHPTNMCDMPAAASGKGEAS